MRKSAATMGDSNPRFTSLAWAGALIATSLAGCALNSHDLSKPQVVDFVADMISEAPLLTHTDYCERFASPHGSCEHEQGFETRVSVETEVSCTMELASGSYVVRISSGSAGAQRIDSDVEILYEDGEIRAVNPVWWAERKIDVGENAVDYPGRPSLLDGCTQN